MSQQNHFLILTSNLSLLPEAAVLPVALRTHVTLLSPGCPQRAEGPPLREKDEQIE